MEMMKDYADLVRRIDIFKAQLELIENDLMYWHGPNKPLWSKGAREYGLDTAALRVDEIMERKRKLEKQIEFHEEIRQEILENINQLQGLPYRIARLRFIEGYSYQQVAEKLGYSYGYIRNVMSKSDNEMTAISENR